MWARRHAIVRLLGCLLVLMWGACIREQSKAAADDLQTPIGTSAETAAAAVDCERTHRASRFLANDTLDEFIKYVYNRNGQLKRTNSYNGADLDRLEAYVTYTYNATGQLTKVSLYGANDVLVYYGVNQYNAQGQIIKASAFGPGDILLYYVRFSYNAQDRLTRITLYKSDDSLLYVGKITYNSRGQMARLSLYDDAAATADDLVAYVAFTYNRTSRLLSEETLYIVFPFIGPVKSYYVNFTYKTGVCAPGNADSLFIWDFLSIAAELLFR